MIWLPSVAFISGSIAGGGRFTPVAPSLSYAGSGASNNGKFNIENYNSSYVYTASNGTVSGSVVTVTDATASSTLTAKLPKGISQSSSITAERKAPDQYYVVTIPFQCYGNGGGCVNNHCGCGTYHLASEGWAYNGFWACCDARSYYYNTYISSGYTWGGSDYTNGAGEWWKIT